MKSKKSSILFLSFLTIFAVGLIYFQIRGAIFSPFKKSEQTAVDKQIESTVNILATQDTDEDGLTDFDEEFVYQTSVYLTDSDSDGFTDKQEADAGSDPLNPNSTPKLVKSETGSETNFLEKTFKAEEIQSFQEAGTEAKNQNEISAQEIRDLLVNSAGLSRDVVDKLDDEMLIKLYNETKQETGIDLQTLGQEQAAEKIFDISQMRQILIEQGVDETMLNQVDDATLEQMFLEALTQ